MARVDGFGISVELPSGFEGEVFGIPLGPGETAATGVQTFSTASEELAPSARSTAPAVAPTAPPVLHVATFPLPAERGDFGNGAVDSMGTEDVFIALCEYGAAAAQTPLYAPEGFPRLTAADFSTTTLHRSFDNHSGCQKFFHVGNRAFCLYVVLGSHNFRTSLVNRANAVIERIEVATS